MTGRDFRAIASVLAGARQNGADVDECHNDAIDALTQDFARFLASTNPRFDRERFLAAAMGTPEHKGDKPRARDYARSGLR
jgi:hypothetical protein